MGDETKPLKSAVEIALERLRQKDADAGVASQPLTDQQKTAIAEVRNFYEAKLAVMEVVHRSTLRATVDPGERDGLEVDYRRERERLTFERDRKIDKLRST